MAGITTLKIATICWGHQKLGIVRVVCCASKFWSTSPIHTRLKSTFRTKRAKLDSAMFPALQTENNCVHIALEKLQDYQNHVLPHPQFLLSAPNDSCSQNYQFGKRDLVQDVNGSKNDSKANKLFDTQHNSDYITTHKEESLFDTFGRISLENLPEKRSLSSLTFITRMCQLLHTLPDNEFLRVMMYTTLWNTDNCSVMLSALDAECCTRMLDWPLEDQLLVADIWYHLHIGRKCTYTTKLIEYFMTNLNKLTPSQLIHFLFIINVKRKADPNQMKQIELRLVEIITFLTPEELAVVSLAYFKTSTKITSILVFNHMANSLVNTMSHIDPLILTSIVKSLRYSFQFESKQLIALLLRDAANNYVWKSDFRVAVHLCLLGINHHVYSPELLNKILDDLPKFKNIRLKDIEKMLYTFSRFNHLKGDVQNNSAVRYLKKELSSQKRKNEIMRFPHPYLSSLLYMAYMGVFIHEDLHNVFSNQFYKILKTNSAATCKRELATLDYLVELDVPCYTGNRLDAQRRATIMSEHRFCILSHRNEETFSQQVIKKLRTVLEDVVKTEAVVAQVLPYMDNHVFVVACDSKRFYKPPEEFLTSISKGDLVRAGDEMDWIVVWPLTKKDVFHEDQLTGFSIVKERHFMKLGYKLITVPIYVYNDINKIHLFLKDSFIPYLSNSQ